VRFVPKKDFNGQVQLVYHAWDQTQGTAGGTFNISTAAKVGGTTAFSTGVHYSSLRVIARNDAPVISGVGGTIVYPYAASPIFLAPGASVTDIDGGYLSAGTTLEVKGALNLDFLGLGIGFRINYSQKTVSYGSLSNIVGTIKVSGSTTYDGKGGRSLIVIFKDKKVTPQIAGQMIASVTFGFVGTQGYLPDRTISFTLNEGNLTSVKTMVVKVQK
jgi:hypothetical protein